jgi:hypothetical protein
MSDNAQNLPFSRLAQPGVVARRFNLASSAVQAGLGQTKEEVEGEKVTSASLAMPQQTLST